MYHESREHYESRMVQMVPEAATIPRQPDPMVEVREQLALALIRDGHVIEYPSIREEKREPVVVDALGRWTSVPEGQETGHIVTWSATGHENKATDADDPVLDYSATGDDGELRFRIPEPQASRGGSVRLRHNLGGEVTALAFDRHGDGLGYMLAMPIDDNVLHIELYGGTAEFRVTKDG